MLLMTSNTRSGGVGQGHAVPRQRSERSAEPWRTTERRVFGHQRRWPVFSTSSRTATAAFT